MKNSYFFKNGSEKTGGKVLGGKLNFLDLKDFITTDGLNEIKLQKVGDETEITLYWASAIPCWRSQEGFGDYAIDIGLLLPVYRYDKFTDIVKILDEFEFHKNDDILITFKEDVVFTYDTETFVPACEAYFCETDSEWYSTDDDLIWVEDNGYYFSDDENVFFCDYHEEYEVGDRFEVHVGNGIEWWCEDEVDLHTFTCDDCGEIWSDDEMYHIDRPDCYVCPSCYNDSYYYCDECDSCVSEDYWDYDENCCDECSGRNSHVRSYHWHHNHDFKNKNMLFASGKMIPLGESKTKKTCGLELEVSKDSRDGQGETIEKVNTLIEDNEIYYEHDGSLDEGGFELITGVHTFDSIKKMPWREILTILSENGYRSNDGGLCGLHIHIGRAYFGRDDNEQSCAIGKIYAFYAMFWDDLVKASRRKKFSYCNNPFTEGSSLADKLNTDRLSVRNTIYSKAKAKEGNHGLALNNSNSGTFEFRLGRGTLKYESFMAWIDLTLTIAKNSRRIAIKDLNNCDKWLDGITTDTALYLKSKNAFAESNLIKTLTEEEVEVCA